MERFPEKLAKDMVDGLLRQTSNKQQNNPEEPAIDPDTAKKLIQREIKMAADPDYELQELAKQKAAWRLRHSMAQQGGTMMDEEKQSREDELRQQIASTAIVLLEKGVDPKTVGQYVLGSTPVMPVTVAGGQPSQGLTIKDLKDLLELMSPNKGSNKLEETLSTLLEQLKSLKPSPPVDPLTMATQQTTAVKQLITTFKELGLIREGTPTVAGEPLEVVKEKHRHDETMLQLKANIEHKDRLTKIAEEIPERVGRGLAKEIREGGMEAWPCSECGATIYVPPETGDIITCGKCKQQFRREPKGELEPKD